MRQKPIDVYKRQALRSKLIGAALYPAIVTLVAIVIVVFLVSYVVPQVAAVFAGTKRALPFLTVAMMAVSSFVRTYGWLMLIAIVLGAIGLRIALANELFRQKFDAAWLRLPLVGRLARGYNAARFSSTLAMLASAGVPILKALQAAAETLNNRAMRADALDALVLVREGAPLASAMAQKKRFPGLVAMFAPVSYTHLDVYKRQGQRRNPPDRHGRGAVSFVQLAAGRAGPAAGA